MHRCPVIDLDFVNILLIKASQPEANRQLSYKLNKFMGLPCLLRKFDIRPEDLGGGRSIQLSYGGRRQNYIRHNSQ